MFSFLHASETLEEKHLYKYRNSALIPRFQASATDKSLLSASLQCACEHHVSVGKMHKVSASCQCDLMLGEELSCVMLLATVVRNSPASWHP